MKRKSELIKKKPFLSKALEKFSFFLLSFFLLKVLNVGSLEFTSKTLNGGKN
jgi:hypothetical protein